MFLNALRMSHLLLKEVLKEGDFVVDATMGNGNDTLFLSRLVGETGKVLAFDIQEEAIQRTRERLLREKAPRNVQLILEGHENVANYVERGINGAVFNLGFLPRGNEKVITQAETTICSLTTILKKLEKKGRVCVVLYYGHVGGTKEKEAVEKWCEQLSSDEFCVLRYALTNQKNQPPLLLCIERK